MSVTEDFVSRCVAVASEDKAMLAVKEVIEQATRDGRIQDELSHQLGLHLLHLSDDLTVVNVVAPKRSDYALPHRAHDHRMWAVIGILEGQEENRFYRHSEDSIVPSGDRVLDAGEILVLGSDAIHSVSNPSVDRLTCALHVYGGDLVNAARSMWCEPELREEPYNVRRVTGTTLAD